MIYLCNMQYLNSTREACILISVGYMVIGWVVVTSTCVIVWLTISHYIVLAIFGNRDFFLKLHHQCFVFITSWICYNLTPPATSKHCLLYTFGQCCNELYMYTMNKELLLLHMYKMNSFSRASHKTMTSASLFCWPCSSPCICMHWE